MTRIITKALATAAVAAAIAAGAGGCVANAMDFRSADELQALSGTYASDGAESWYGGFGTREFVFNDGTWSLIFTHALDPEMKMRTFQFRTGGAFKVGRESAVVAGAYHTVFNEDWKHVTLLTADPDVVAAFGMAGCNLTFNLETDISETGCAAWRPVAECGQDHDLLAASDAGVHFGVRPEDNDMCSEDKTPQALLPAVLKR